MLEWANWWIRLICDYYVGLSSTTKLIPIKPDLIEKFSVEGHVLEIRYFSWNADRLFPIWSPSLSCLGTPVTAMLIKLGCFRTAWPEMAKFRRSGYFLNLCQTVGGLFRVWQVFQPPLVKLFCFWAAFQCCKWPRIEK